MSDGNADDKWSVRGVPKSYRDAISQAAARQKIQVGAWICRAVDLAIQAEREPVVLMPAGYVSDDAADARLTLLERAVAASVKLAETPGVPTMFRRRVNRLLREALPAPRGKSHPVVMLDAPIDP